MDSSEGPMGSSRAPPTSVFDAPSTVMFTEPAQVRALSHPVRTTILGLLHERAATVSELAAAVGRPKSTVAHHVKVLRQAGLVQVVRTRRVRAIEERFYGRTARLFLFQTEDPADGRAISAVTLRQAAIRARLTERSRGVRRRAAVPDRPAMRDMG